MSQLFASFQPQEVVKVKGVRGEFVVTGYAKDGSVHVYGGTRGRKLWRSFAEERLHRVKPR